MISPPEVRFGGLRRQLPATGLLIAAAALAVLSLGLPWTVAVDSAYGTTLFTPGSCVTVYDYQGYASLECIPGMIFPGYSSYGSPALPGYAIGVRVFLLAGALLVFLGSRHAASKMRLVGLLVIIAGWLTNIGSQSGQITYLLAIGCLWYWLRATSTEPVQPRGSGILPRHAD